MKRFVVAAAAGCTVFTAAAFPAQASPPIGLTCQLVAPNDGTAEGGTRTGLLAIGPIGRVSSGFDYTMICDVYVNGDAITDDRLVVDGTSTGAIQAAAGGHPVSFHARAEDTVSVCTSAIYDGVTWYWHPGPAGEVGTWDYTFDLDRCRVVPWVDTMPTACPVLLAADGRLGTPLAAIWGRGDCDPYTPIV